MSLCEILKNNIVDRYETLINHAPMGILLIDLDGDIIELNPKMLEILGSPSAEETRKINMLSFPPLIEAGISDIVRRSLSGTPYIVDEVEYTTVWKKHIVVRFTAVPIYDEQDFICFSLLMMEDMTNFNQVKLELQRANNMLKTVIDAIPSLVWMKDSEGRYVHSNKSFNKFNSFVGEDIIGKTDYDIWPEDKAKTLREDDAKAMECSYPIEVHDIIDHPELGTRHFRTIKIGVCNEKQEAVGSVGISCDVTKQYEQEKLVLDAINTLSSSLANNIYVK